MATEVRLPEIAENIDSAVVLTILVATGDRIDEGQGLLEIETEKAVAEVPAPAAGTVTEIHVNEGDEIQVDQLIVTLDEQDDAAADEASDEPDAEAAEAEKAQETEDAAEVQASEGTEEAADAQETEGTEQDASRAKADKDAAAKTKDTGARQTAGQPDAGGTGSAGHTAAPQRRIPSPAAPSVRRFARELGVDIDQVEGSGPGGRIAMDDVKAQARKINEANQRPGGQTAPTQRDLPDFSRWGSVERRAMGGIRKKTAQHLAAAWAAIPHVTQFDQADVTELEQMRKRYGPKVEKAGGKLTVTAVLLKAVAAALKAYPQFNASLDEAREEIIFKQYFHIGVAADTDHGLLVPVIRDVDQKNLIELSLELGEAAEKARNRKLSLDEMSGATFTVSNLGGLGGTGFTPIINWPEAAILGVARSRVEAVWNQDEERFAPRMLLPLALSYDHRIIDGADAVRFLRQIVDIIEEPFLLALEG